MTSLRSGTKSYWTDTLLKCAQRSYVGILLLFFFLILIMEKAIAPHSTTLACKIPWVEEPSRLQSMGSRRVGHDWATSLSLFTFMHWRGQWQPTPVFLLENPRDGGAWWAVVYGVTQSRTPLKWLSSSSSSSIINNVVLVYSRVIQLYIYTNHFSNSFSI